MKTQIKHRFTEAVLHEGDYVSILEAVSGAIKAGADLSGANLYGANLSGADLSGANLYGADLSDANLSDANLSRVNLYGANLSRVNLYGANLSGADLSDANLSDADLYGANLSDANLSGANLSRVNLYGANLSDADLSDANLYGANISGAIRAELAIAITRILPEGDIIGYKKCKNDVIVKLKIPAEAKRSHAFGRKCRAEFAEVLEIFGSDLGCSQHDGTTRYEVGKRVTCDKWSDDWQTECAGGIHFFITRLEAENY